MIGLKRGFRGGRAQQIVIQAEALAGVELVLLFQSQQRIVRQKFAAGDQVVGVQLLPGEIRVRLMQQAGLNAVFAYDIGCSVFYFIFFPFFKAFSAKSIVDAVCA